MSNYSLWEHLKPEDRVKLKDFQDECYQTKLDIMIMPVASVIMEPHWPTSVKRVA